MVKPVQCLFTFVQVFLESIFFDSPCIKIYTWVKTVHILVIDGIDESLIKGERT